MSVDTMLSLLKTENIVLTLYFAIFSALFKELVKNKKTMMNLAHEVAECEKSKALLEARVESLSEQITEIKKQNKMISALMQKNSLELMRLKRFEKMVLESNT